MKTFKRILFIYIALVAFFSTAAQTVSVLDTIYAPGLVGTLFNPSEENGFGVLVVRGGGVTRQTNRPWCDTLAAHGYTVFTIEYTESLYPGPVRAIKLALEFLRRNAQSFGITTGKIAGLGFSYGSATLAQSIIWDNDDTFFKTDPNLDDHFNAAIFLYGFYSYGDFTNDAQRQKGVCIRHVSNITTPVLLIHGTGDTYVPYSESVRLNDSLVAYGAESKLILYNNLQHGFDLNWPSTTAFTSTGLQAKDSILAFLGSNLVTDFDEKINTTNHVKIYPNPVKAKLTLLSSAIKGEAQLSIFNIQGQKILEQIITNSRTEIDISNEPNGIYFFRFNNGKSVETGKLSKIEY